MGVADGTTIVHIGSDAIRQFSRGDGVARLRWVEAQGDEYFPVGKQSLHLGCAFRLGTAPAPQVGVE